MYIESAIQMEKFPKQKFPKIREPGKKEKHKKHKPGTVNFQITNDPKITPTADISMGPPDAMKINGSVVIDRGGAYLLQAPVTPSLLTFTRVINESQIAMYNPFGYDYTVKAPSDFTFHGIGGNKNSFNITKHQFLSFYETETGWNVTK